MKKLLFLLGCALLLLAAGAGPALADAPYYWVHAVGGDLAALDETGHTLTPVTAIPAGATVVVGYCWIHFHGLAVSQPYAWRQRVTVTNLTSGVVVGHCDESDCQSLWSPLYRWNERWSNSPDFWAYAYNPKVRAEMWARNWFVPCGALPAGEYRVSYNDMLTRTVANPMMDRPGTYRPVIPAYDWMEEPLEFTFTVGVD